MNNQLKVHISPPSKRLNPRRQVLANFSLPPRGESATSPACLGHIIPLVSAACYMPASAACQRHATHLSLPAYAACYMPTSARLCRMLYACSSGMQPACICHLPFVCFSYRILACPSGMLLPANSCLPPACPCLMPLACLSHISLACLCHVHMPLACPRRMSLAAPCCMLPYLSLMPLTCLCNMPLGCLSCMVFARGS